MKVFSGLLGRPRAPELVQLLIEAPDLNHPEARAALQALRARPGEALEALIEAAEAVRRHELERVAELMAQLYSPGLCAEFVTALADPRAAVAMAAAHALERQIVVDPHALLKLLEHPATVKSAVLKVVAGQRAHLRLSELLRVAGRLGGADRAALFGLMKGLPDTGAVPELAARLDALDPDYRLGVVRLLGGIAGPAPIGALSRALGDRDWRVRLAAIEALAARPEAADAELLVRCLTDSQFEVQARAIELLKSVRHPGVPRLLAPLLGHAQASVRRAAVEVLSVVATADSIRDLLSSAKDRDWWVRSRSADVLGKLGGERVLEAVRELLADSDAFIRRTAVEIINASGGPGVYDALLGALQDPDWWVRERAIDGIAATRDPRALPLLRSMLEQETQEQPRLVLIRALSRQGSAEVIADLARLLPQGSQNARRAVLHAFAQLRDVNRNDAIGLAVASLASDPDIEIRRLASALISDRERPAAPMTPVPGVLPAAPWLAPAAPLSAPAPAPVLNATEATDLDSEPTPVRAAGHGPKRAAASSEMAVAALEPGSLLGERYRVVRQLGRGAFGTVLLVEDVAVNEPLAMKFLHPHLASDKSITRRFVRELRLARRITHPGIIRIHDLVHIEGTLAIAMEYFPSKPLTFEMKKGPMDIERVRNIATQMCQAMASAHAAKVIHRDLKPANVLLNDAGIAKIADFGISAAVSDESTRLTKAGAVVGTPRYMSPEQVKGEALDPRSDIYSLATILYEMLAGRPLFVSGDSLSMMFQHVQGHKEPPSVHRSGIPLELDALVMACLEVDPALRPQSMEALGSALSGAPPVPRNAPA